MGKPYGLRFTVETDWSGQQQRDYGDHIWTGEVRVETFDHNGEPQPWDKVDEGTIKELVRAVVPFKDEYVWPERRLKWVVQTEPGIWQYRLEADFVD